MRRLAGPFTALVMAVSVARSAHAADRPVTIVDDPRILAALDFAKVKGIGFCSPTYFIFQMRIDNHATP
ncbi:hypothetical protein ACVDG8_000885 [Mesorhizobium sp. ORM8.1]